MRAQGYVHAQERFFEMDVRRHATAGRLAELFGEDALETDVYVRTMGWRRVAEAELPLLDPDTRVALDAYAAGRQRLPRGPRAQRDRARVHRCSTPAGLDYTPEPWTAVDSLAWLKAMAWDLRGNMVDEIDRTPDRGRRRPPSGRRSCGRPYPPEHAPIVGQGAVVDGVFEQDADDRRAPGCRPAPAPFAGPVAGRACATLAAATGRMPAWLGRGDGIGSNAWVVSGEHTDTGEPILANDPHLGVSLPGVWMQVGLHCRTVGEACPYDVAGFSFSGVPGVIIGHNADIAWGFTNLGPDVTDLYVERVVGDQWRHGGELRPLEHARRRPSRSPTATTSRSPSAPPTTARSSATSTTCSPRSPARRRRAARAATDDVEYAVSLSWTALDPSPDRRRDPGARPGQRLDVVPRRRRRLRRARAEHRLRRPRGPHRLPGRRARPDPQVRQRRAAALGRAGARRTTGPASTSPTTACPASSTPTRASWSPPTSRSSDPTTPTSSATTSTAATAPSASATSLDAAARRRRHRLGRRRARPPSSTTATRSPPVLVPYLLRTPPRPDVRRRRPAPARATGTSPSPPRASRARPRPTSTSCGATCCS